MKHHLKLNKRFADAVYSGDIRFEIRNNDRAFQKGDEVEFSVVDDDGRKYRRRGEDHPIEDITFEISFVLSGWGLKDGYVVFGIKEKK